MKSDKQAMYFGLLIITQDIAYSSTKARQATFKHVLQEAGIDKMKKCDVVVAEHLTGRK